MKITALLILLLMCSWTAAAQDASIAEVAKLGRGTASVLDWRPDGEILAVGGSAGLWLFNTDFEQVAHFDAGRVSRMEWSPTGDRLAFSTFDNDAYIWSIDASGTSYIQEFKFAARTYYGLVNLSWSPDGKYIAVSRSKGSPEVLDAASGEVLLILQDEVSQLDWSPNGELLAGSMTDDSGIGVWDAATGQRLKALVGVGEGLYFGFVTFSPDGTRLAASTSAPISLHVWDVSTWELANTPVLDSLTAANWALLWSPNGKHLAEISGMVEANRFHGITVTDAKTWEQPYHFGYPDGVSMIDWMPNGEVLTTVGFSGVIRQWEVATDAVREYPLFTPPNQFGTWSPDSTLFASSAEGDELPIFVWRVNDLAEADYTPFRTYYETGVKTIGWTPDNKNLITVSENLPIWIANYRAYRRDVFTDDPSTILIEIIEQDAPLPVVGWQHDFGGYAISWLQPHVVGVYEDWREIHFSFRTQQEAVFNIEWSPDDRQIATLSGEREEDSLTLELWDAQTGHRQHQMVVDTEAGFRWQSKLAWSPDGRRLSLIARQTRSDILYVIDSAGKLLFKRSFDVPIWLLQWNNDGNRIAVMTMEDAIGLFLFDGLTGGRVEVFHVNSNNGVEWHPTENIFIIADNEALSFYDGTDGSPIHSIAFSGIITDASWSPDGSMLAVFYHDETIGIWSVSGLIPSAAAS